jgi:hypothetical protein
LYALRRIKSEGADDSERIHTLSYNALDSEAFRDIDADEMQRLVLLVQALQRVADNRAVTRGAMSGALTAEQYEEYLRSFDFDLSHIESDYSDDMPSVLYDYVALLKLGDKYTRIANLHRRAVKRDTHGRTAHTRYLVKAEACYEQAVVLVCNALELDTSRNPNADPVLAANVQRWLDRDVDTRDGFEPRISAECVPRLRGSKSKYSQAPQRAVVGERLRKYWRQRDALATAALALMYDDEEIERQTLNALDTEAEAFRIKYNLLKPTQPPVA